MRGCRGWSHYNRTRLDGHDGPVTEADFSPNGQYALTTSPRARIVRLWAVDSGREVAVFGGQRGAESAEPAATHASFNSDGTQVVLFSGENFAEVLRVFPTAQDLIDYARHIVPRELTACERREFFLPVNRTLRIAPADLVCGASATDRAASRAWRRPAYRLTSDIVEALLAWERQEIEEQIEAMERQLARGLTCRSFYLT